MNLRARIVGTGMCVPDRVVTNDDLAKLMDTSDEWIMQRSGIRERRYIDPGTQPADLARKATERALEAAKLETSDIDCIVLATLSSQADFPGTSFFLHEALGTSEIPCFDLRAQCSGFVYSLAVANGFIRSGMYRRVLVVGCEVHSTGIDLSDEGRDVAVLFGDGAGAAILEANDDENDPAGLIEVRLHAQGEFARKLWIEAPASGHTPVRIDHAMIDERRHFPKMEGRFVFKHAVTRMPQVLMETLHAASLKLEDIDLFLFHQANLRINEYVAKELEIPEEKQINNIEKYGNCSAASIPMLLDEAIRAGRLAPGQLFSMTTFGSGFSWSSAVARL
ncbi:MAG: ketoacyl-ACP synthase III [Deltaproteobacteria bacterium]|nr:ketoacyl-ACP synthase III [Deltaproteobacteria bacterium]MBW2667436.1 ketoacyl-ACP synthase III [Deltaproteobacteria bacterium]